LKKGRKEAAMSDFRAVAHLEEQLGEAGWRALIDSANTGKVKEFCNALVASGLPTTMTVGGRTYDILSFLRGDEKSVLGNTMVKRAKEMTAHLGQDDREHILAHQDEIPAALRGRVVFVFTDDRHPDNPEYVYYVVWDDDCWVPGWGWLARDWHGYYRVFRRQ
jgi:hypothetical protein